MADDDDDDDDDVAYEKNGIKEEGRCANGLEIEVTTLSWQR